VTTVTNIALFIAVGGSVTLALLVTAAALLGVLLRRLEKMR
jgi:hypothetical protein